MGWLRFVLDPPSVPSGVDKKPKTPSTGVYYDTEWSRSLPARLIRRATTVALMKPVIGFFGAPKVIGADRLKDVEGPVVFAANHHSHADTTVLLTTIPSHLRHNLAIAAGADYFFPNRLVGAASALFIGAIPIERQRLSRLSVANTMDAVAAGRNLLVFPEGGRSPDGWGAGHRPGAAFVAMKSDVPVVPVYIDGTGNILPKGKNWPKRSRCAVVFGSPLSPIDDEDARGFATRIESKVAELADEFANGWWQARRNAGSGSTPVLSGPEAGAWRRRWLLGPKPGGRRTTPGPKRWPRI